jgi:SAM-dependent methyltransferase
MRSVMEEPSTGRYAHPLAPVAINGQVDSVSHSLAILSTVYHYNHWIFDSIRQYLGSGVVEVGAGVGNITQFMLNAERLVCLEPFEPYFDYLSKRFAQHMNVQACRCPVEEVPNADVPAEQFDSVVCLNVLEHISDDVGALRRMKELLRPGGRAIVFVPAMPFLFGEMDKAMGHVRRYTLSSLRRAFRAAGLKPTTGRYMNILGAGGWWWNGRVLKRSTIPASATRTFDRMVPVLSAIERIIPVLVGQSVLVVGTA